MVVFEKIITAIRKNKLDIFSIIVPLVGIYIYSFHDLIGVILYFAVLGISIIITAKTDILLPLYIVLIGVTAQLESSFHHIITYGLTWGLILIWLLFKIYNKTPIRIPDKRVMIMVSLYIFWSLISSLLSNNVAHCITINIRTIIFFTIILIYFDWINTKKIDLIIYPFIIVGTILCISIMLEFLSIKLLINEAGVVRYSGIYSGANAAGFVLAITCVLTFYKAISTPYIKSKLTYVLLLLLCIFALFLTNSRSSWLLMILAISIIAISSIHLRKYYFLLIIVTIITIIISNDLMEQILLLARLEHKLTYRDILWESAINIFKDYPLTGVGPDNIREYIVQYSGIDPTSWTGSIILFSRNNAHNFFLNVAAETGIIGLLIVISIVLTSFKILIENYKIVKFDNNSKLLIITIGALFVGMISRSFFEGNGIITNGWLSFDMYFWLFLAILLQYNKSTSIIGRII